MGIFLVPKFRFDPNENLIWMNAAVSFQFACRYPSWWNAGGDTRFSLGENSLLQMGGRNDL